MKSKFIVISFLLLGFVINGYSQYRQTGIKPEHRTIIPEEKQKRLKNIDMIANLQFAFRNDFEDGIYTGSAFKMEQFRLEVKGWVTDRIYFRFRHRYTSPFEPQSMDKIIKGIAPIAGIALAGSAFASSDMKDPYLSDAEKGMVKNAAGECWTTRGGVAESRVECGDHVRLIILLMSLSLFIVRATESFFSLMTTSL